MTEQEAIHNSVHAHEAAAAEIEMHANKLLEEAKNLADSSKKIADMMREAGQKTIADIQAKLDQVRATTEAIKAAGNGKP